MSVPLETRWELVCCTGCGHDHARRQGSRQFTLPCRCGRGEQLVVQLAVVDPPAGVRCGWTLGQAHRTLRAIAEQERRLAGEEPDDRDAARRVGRAEGFEQALEILGYALADQAAVDGDDERQINPALVEQVAKEAMGL